MLKEKTKTIVTADCTYWIVFCTKYRKEVLTGEVVCVIKDLIRKKLSSPGLDLLKLDINPNYVVLNVRVDPQIAVHQVVRQLKAITSKNLRSEFEVLRTTLPSLWTLNYYCTTKAVLTKEEVNSYVQTQKRRRE